MLRSVFLAAAVALAAGAAGAAPLVSALPAATARDRAVPRYDHVIVIVEENTGYRTIVERGWAPKLAALAHEYGSATHMYAETHPSEANYIALLGGDTFGIHDDDAWYCVPGSARAFCHDTSAADYVSHLIDGPNLATKLRAKGLAWRAYLEDIPAPGSLAMMSAGNATTPPALYAAKHTGFTNFASVHRDTDLAHELVGFDALHADLRAGTVPAFALVVPNQCNEMHGIGARNAPADCSGGDEALVRRGDAYAADLVAAIQASPIWTAPNANTAIVITWDEDGKEFRAPGSPNSCCVTDAHNPGGGHIATIVVTSHGPRGAVDPTPYDHYSLLRTIEDALRLDGHLRHAGDATVLPMTPLFATTP
ncbi:MAG: phosphoesterase [Candidatus Eremiobacteraeota bacterium]|nr:phosphoesterase [Candidatus Eremiobacteraeota bacterium]